MERNHQIKATKLRQLEGELLPPISPEGTAHVVLSLKLSACAYNRSLSKTFAARAFHCASAIMEIMLAQIRTTIAGRGSITA